MSDIEAVAQERKPVMNTLEVLVAAKKKIEDPEHWTINWFAKDIYDHTLNVDDPKAYKFCALGSVYSITKDNRSMAYKLYELLNHSSYELYDESMENINDCQGHEAVMQVYNHAIEKVKQELQT